MRSIDDRISLSVPDSALTDGAPAPAAGADAAAAAAPLISPAGGDGHSPVEDALAAAAATTPHNTLAAPGIGLGYGSLDGIEDTETALVMTANGLVEITSGAQGYLVKSDVPMDATLAKILSFDMAAGGFGDPSHAIGGLTAFDLSKGHPTPQDGAFDITGATGADTIAGASGSDIIHGGAGADVINAGSGDDIAWGDAGADSIDGGAGNDQLWGGAGADTLLGGEGNDMLFGGSGADNLQGGDGNDLMLGGLDNDSIAGGAGNDVLVGGGGADTLTGGDGSDLFVFAQGDSGTGATGEDLVTDFTTGQDKLDLTGFTKALHAVQAFDHHAFEMVLTDNATGTLIQIDLNGDGVSDQEIQVNVTGGGHLTSGDYVI